LDNKVPQDIPDDDPLKNAPFLAPMLGASSRHGALVSQFMSDAIRQYWDTEDS
jgi:hypothetical protein